MIERIIAVRKSAGLNQTDFGKKLGVGRGVITNIEGYKVSPKESFLQLICSVFSISEEWLRTGAGEMYAARPNNPMDALATQYGLSDIERMIIEEYVGLDQTARKVIYDYIMGVHDRIETKLAKDVLDPLIDAAESVNFPPDDLPDVN